MVEMGVWSSTISANINKIFSFFWLDLLWIILCQTSVVCTISVRWLDKKYHDPWFRPLVLVQAFMLRVCDFGQSYQRSTGNIFLPTCAAGSEQGHMGKNIRQCIWREAASFLWSICQQLELPDFNLHHPLRWADWLCGCFSPLNRRGSQGGNAF